MTAAGATIVAVPVEIVMIGNYLIVAGSVAGAVSQATVMEEKD